ncbi:hypothetical protein [Sphingomonas abietis]|uniref:Uncharacterized protein n=1 Tax=Sphingomonas abietis TaxID=3012344 RepID=A0ABY7NPA2_9SPHN|nr:hypothetical protein [Sphingomonas abietis]WBO21306.1 hypothetical protein PBT88_14055 [Sphingomonas abietis]
MLIMIAVLIAFLLIAAILWTVDLLKARRIRAAKRWSREKQIERRQRQEDIQRRVDE